MKKIMSITMMLVLLLSTGCGQEEEKEFEPSMETIEDKLDEITFEETEEMTNYIKIIMDNEKEIVLELYPGVAPISVENFQKLVSENFYDDIIFHRVIEGFMIQGGDPDGLGTGGSDETIEGEFAQNGFDNILSHERGVISMARSQDYNSASSQFFIMHEDNQGLDGGYAAFGKVLIGMDVVDEIATTEVDGERPVNEQKIKTIKFLSIK